MEKDIKPSNIDIVVKSKEGLRIFEIKNPKLLNRNLLNDIKKEFFLMDNNSIVIYPEQEIIESQRMFIEDTSQII
ncbi:MAG: hypothetical protein PHC38_07100 [Weeksellaceae bacterium]|jgi:hypothetical protein|nr:hypothetical protein [Weeksellaceae bacterium]